MFSTKQQQPLNVERLGTFGLPCSSKSPKAELGTNRSGDKASRAE